MPVQQRYMQTDWEITFFFFEGLCDSVASAADKPYQKKKKTTETTYPYPLKVHVLHAIIVTAGHQFSRSTKGKRQLKQCSNNYGMQHMYF